MFKRMSLLLAVSLLAGFRQPTPSFPASLFGQTFTATQLREDARHLRQGLEKLHPALYRYTPRREMDSLFDALSAAADGPMRYQEFFRAVSRVVAQVRCQHTVAAPNGAVLERILREGRFFPLKVFWEFAPVGAYSTFDFSSRANLPPGTRIVRINGQSMQDIYRTLIPYFSSDGGILTNKHSRLQHDIEFQFWYYVLIGQPETFEVVLQMPDGGKRVQSYRAVTLGEWQQHYKKFSARKDTALQRFIRHYETREEKKRAEPVRLSFPAGRVGLLTVSTLDAENFTEKVAGAFAQVKRWGIGHLIIDVRGNGGGSDINGQFLFTHLLRQPAPYFDSLYATADIPFLLRHTDKDSAWWTDTRPLLDSLPGGRWGTQPSVNEGLRVQQPPPNAFTGKVYVLMDGRSASTTAEFTAATHFHGLATFIGEESGGAYHGGNGGDFATLTLPHSRIDVLIPLARYVMNSGNTRLAGRGTLPDHPVPGTIADVLALRDPQLAFALKLIGQSN